jgi:UDP-perosamine 4-acetyltransferase
MKEKVVICGAGAHCKVVLDILLQADNYQIIGLLDSNKGDVLGIPIIGDDSLLEVLFQQGIRHAFVAIGSNQIRKAVTQKLLGIGYTLCNVISCDSRLSPYSDIGQGIFVNRGVIVNACAHIGDGTILNTNCSVDHDCCIGQYVHIAPGVTVSGGTAIGDGSFLGTGCNVIDRITIGEDVMIGAGAAVVKDIASSSVAVGVPAKVIRSKN